MVLQSGKDCKNNIKHFKNHYRKAFYIKRAG